MNITTKEVYELPVDKYGWRILPSGNRVKIGIDVDVSNWASVGDGARVGDRASVPTSECIVTIDFLGSRVDTLTAQINVAPIIIATGCFMSDVDAFEKAVNEKHGDNPYGHEYRATIAWIKALQAARFPDLANG